MIKEKSVVYYAGKYEIFKHKPLSEDLSEYADEDGFLRMAYIFYVIDHPILGNQHYIRSSVIVNLEEETGIIETLNTMYVPYKR